MRSFNASPAWGFRSVSYWFVLLVAVGLLFIGIRFLIDPDAGAAGFGIAFQIGSDSAYGQVKGIRDLYCGLMLCLLLWIRQPRLTALLFGAAIIIPLTDGLLVLKQNGATDVAHLAIHWGTVLFCLVTVILLLRRPK